MAQSRKEFLDWCKKRALEYVERDQPHQAVTSMLSDLNKWGGQESLYPTWIMTVQAQEGILCRNNVVAVRDWIEGFN